MIRRGQTYSRVARKIHLRLKVGARFGLYPLVTTLVAVAPTAVHRAAAAALRDALREKRFRDAGRMASTMMREPDTRAEKMISHRYRCLWICNPKVASRSIRQVLWEIDPDVEYLEQKLVSEIHERDPRVRDYFTFTFIRHPYPRAHSFYVDKYLNKPDEHRYFIDPFHGASADNGFDQVCEWLNSPWGSDQFADRHWLSQHLQIRLPDGRLPDFIGRHENMDADWRAMLETVGMPVQALPVLNTRLGWEPSAEQVEAARREPNPALHARNRELLHRRYAEDFEILGYSPDELP